MGEEEMKANTAKTLTMVPELEPAIHGATVVSVDAGVVEVRIEDVVRRAEIAFSCLVRPQPGDLALAARTETGQYFIMGILSRPGAQDLTLAFPAEATLMAEQGPLNLCSREQVTLATEGGLHCLSRQAIHRSQEAVVDYHQLIARGSELKATFDSVLLVSRVINTMARHAIAKFLAYVRHTEEYDQVSAGQMTRTAEGLYSVDSEHTSMVSKKTTRIDGSQLFMG
jgi:hypothetical protein